ncbi:MAG: cytochrome c [Burkholderiaceae bacterium]
MPLFRSSAQVMTPNERSGVSGQATRRAAGVAAVLSLLAMPAAVLAQDLKPDLEAAKAKVSNCIGCHQIPLYRASFPQVYSVPMIVGQGERYLVNALTAYRKGDRSHPTMRAIAGSLSDQDIVDLAAFYANGAK